MGEQTPFLGGNSFAFTHEVGCTQEGNHYGHGNNAAQYGVSCKSAHLPRPESILFREDWEAIPRGGKLLVFLNLDRRS